MAEATIFNSELAAARTAAKPDYIARIRQAAMFLETAGTSKGVRQPGETAPDFVLTAPSGRTVALSELLSDGPVVISFFRGEWCPFCRVELKGLLAAQPAIAARGAALLLISPEPPSSDLVAEVDAIGDRIYVLHDPMLGVALSYGLVYMIPAALRHYYLGIDFDIPRIFNSGSWLMPLPADFLVGVDGRIALSYADVDFTVRLDPARMLEALSRLPA